VAHIFCGKITKTIFKGGNYDKTYGPETRGGTANCSITISETPVNSPVISKADTVIVMNKPSLEKFESKVKPQGKLFVNSSLIDQKSARTDIETFYIPVNEIAGKLGNFKVANMVMLGAYLAKTQLFEDALIIKLLTKLFGEGKAHLIALNNEALAAGRDYFYKKHQ